MKTKRLLIIIALVGAVFLAYATTKPRQATVSELSTTWVAWASMSYLRIELREDGTGLCGFHDRTGDNTPKLHEITKWPLKDYNIEITLKPIDAGWQMSMSGTATPTQLHLKLGDGRKNGWRSEATLEHEKVIESIVESTKKRMQDYRR
jgi:hypothetical protein